MFPINGWDKCPCDEKSLWWNDDKCVNCGKAFAPPEIKEGVSEGMHLFASKIRALRDWMHQTDRTDELVPVVESWNENQPRIIAHCYPTREMDLRDTALWASSVIALTCQPSHIYIGLEARASKILTDETLASRAERNDSSVNNTMLMIELEKPASKSPWIRLATQSFRNDEGEIEWDDVQEQSGEVFGLVIEELASICTRAYEANEEIKEVVAKLNRDDSSWFSLKREQCALDTLIEADGPQAVWHFPKSMLNTYEDVPGHHRERVITFDN